MATRNNMLAFPDANPIHFVRVVTFNFNDTFPTNDNILSSQKIWDDVEPLPYSFNWLTNKNLYFQYRKITGTVTFRVYNYQTGEIQSTPSGFALISPDDWASDYDVFRRYFRIENEGCYKILATANNGDEYEYYESDVIHVKSSLTDCIYIKYLHSANDKGLIFTTDGVSDDFIGEIYIEANLDKTAPGNNLETYENDRGYTQIVQSTPTKNYDIAFEPLSKHYANKLNLIFSFDEVYINDIRMQAKEPPEFENLENSFGIAVKVTVNQYDWDYLHDELVINQVFLSNDEDDFISNNSDILIT